MDSQKALRLHGVGFEFHYKCFLVEIYVQKNKG